jgi:RimJ/RimL family protein N-acetyltransferase
MQYQPTINGRFVTLERFTEDHIPELQPIVFDDAIWQNLPYNITDIDSFHTFIAQLREQNNSDKRITYVIRNHANGRVCGSTGFINIDTINRKLEIGPTWLTPTVWGTKINIDSKYLLLNECFEQHNIVRVSFRTRETNIRSQKAIEKIGGVWEGVLRYHRINEDGSFRNTIVYSIIQPDWPVTKAKLFALLDS